MAGTKSLGAANKKFTHSCEANPVNIDNYKSSFADAGYTESEYKEIIDFYVLRAPIAKSGKSMTNGLKSLGTDYNWVERGAMNKLESKLLKKAEMGLLCVIKAPYISLTLTQMKLGGEECCIEHPRAVIKQRYEEDVRENGEAKVKKKETRMECLFRHIRNALAHDGVYVFDNGKIMLEDKDAQSNSGSIDTISARILIKKETLLDWIRVIKKEDESEGIQEVPKITLEEKTAAEQLEVEIAS